MTLQEIEGVLLHPDAHITPGYDLLTVRLKDGSSLQGFGRGQTNFDIQLQDLKGQLHFLHSPEIAVVQKETRSVMKPWSGSPQQLEDMLAYLSRLTGVTPADPKSNADSTPSPESSITFDRIKNPRPGDWLTYNGNLQGNRLVHLPRSTAAT